MYVPDFAGDKALADRYQGKRVLVAGADGFLGANCAYGLHAIGAEVSLITRNPTPRANIPATVLSGDLMDPEFARKAVEGHDVVFDVLGYPNISPSTVTLTPDDIANEFVPHLNLFNAATAAKSNPVVVHVSTRLVYGKPEYLPVDESHPVRPNSIYGTHKLTLEHYANSLECARDLRIVIIRLSSPFGPNGKMSDQSYGILNQFVHKAINNRPIQIYGEGDQERDYVFADDVSYMLLWCGVSEDCVGETLNYGGSTSVSIAQAARTIAGLAGTEVEHVPWPEESKSVETGSYHSCFEKIRSLIPLREQASFEDGIRRTMEISKRELDELQSDSKGQLHAGTPR